MNLSFLLLCGVGGSIIFSSKEFILLEFVGLIVIVIGWNYSKVFLSNMSSYDSTITLMNCSILLLLVIGRSRFGGLDLASLGVITTLMIVVFNSISGYVVNK